MNKAYIIVLGDRGNSHYSLMLDRMRKVGKTLNLVDNIYVLTIQNKDFDNKELVRNYIAGNDYGYCLVVSINSDLSCAWNLPIEKSKLFGNIIQEQIDEKK